MSSTKQAATPNVIGHQLQVEKDFGPTQPPQKVTDSDGRASCLNLSQSTTIIKSITPPTLIGPPYPLHVAPDNSVRFELGEYAKFSMGGKGVLNVDAPNVEGGRFTVTNDNRVGINQKAPAYDLDVTGSIRATQIVYAAGINVTGDFLIPGMKSVQALDGLKPVYFNPATKTMVYLV